MNDKLVRINTIIREEQQDTLKALSAQCYNSDYMRGPTAAECIRAAIDMLTGLPLNEQKQLLNNELVETEKRPRGRKKNE